MLVLFALAGCGGGGKDNLSATPSLTESPAQLGEPLSPRTISLEGALAGVQAAEAPAGVDAGLWDELTSELARVLEERFASGDARATNKFASVPPLEEHNRVTDLVLLDDGAGGYSLEWSYVNTGDYDLNSEVNIADLTPIGQHFGATSADANWDRAWVADGDGNGEVNVADVTPIGQNFLATVGGYVVDGSYLANGPWERLGTAHFPTDTEEDPSVFSYAPATVDYLYYRVVVYDEAAAFGEASDIYFDPSMVLFEPFALSPSGAFVDAPADVTFWLGLDASLGGPIAAEIVEVDESGEVLSVLGNLADDGDPASGDELAGDRIFSHLAALDSPVERTTQYQARITFDTGERDQTLLSEAVEMQFFMDITEERAAAIESQIDEAGDQLATLADSMSVEDAALQLAADLNEDPTVADAGTTGSGRGVWWDTMEGIGCVVYIHAEGERGGGSSNGPPTAQSAGEGPKPSRPQQSLVAYSRSTSAFDLGGVVIGNNKVVGYTPYNDEFTPKDEVPDLIDLFMQSECPDYQEVFFIDEQCTVGQFKGMGGSGVVLISSHGDTRLAPFSYPADSWVFIETREDYIGKIRGNVDLRKKRLILTGARNTAGAAVKVNVFSFTPWFVTYYCRNMPNSIVWIGTCHGANGATMANAFTSAGAQVVFGFSDYVTTDFAYEQAMTLFQALLEGWDTDYAYQYVVETDSTPSEYLKFGSPVWLRPCVVGKWDLTYKWEGRSPRSFTITYVDDATFSTDDGTFVACDGVAEPVGVWDQQGISVIHSYDCGTSYSGKFTDYFTMEGTMIESDDCEPSCSGGDTGTWTAVRSFE
ncbi:hypothetical protein IIA79_01395 [bacterium]|nr:hypothetical protein [bacterium]